MDAPEAELPADFGKYRLIRRIATGGMAEIFLAHERTQPASRLVIKRILPHLVENGEFVSMFLDEARIAAQLHHPNIVEIYDVGRVDGASYIAMEWVHGEDVRRIYNQAFKLQRSLPLSHSIRVIADAAVGLGYAHRLSDLTGKPLGVVHRDVSPQNIIVTYDGHAKVVDFGIAKAASKVIRTRAGVLKGKYSYMSPEQARGDPIDHRTDIFALGIILYETTTGNRLFKRHNELATLQAIMKCDFAPPGDVLNGYPKELEQVTLRALARDPRERYQRAEDFSRDLMGFLRNSGFFVERDAIAGFMTELFGESTSDEPNIAPAQPTEGSTNTEALEEALGAMRAMAPPTSQDSDAVSEELIADVLLQAMSGVPEDPNIAPAAAAVVDTSPQEQRIEREPATLADPGAMIGENTLSDEEYAGAERLPGWAPRDVPDQAPTVVAVPVHSAMEQPGPSQALSRTVPAPVEPTLKVRRARRWPDLRARRWVALTLLALTVVLLAVIAGASAVRFGLIAQPIGPERGSSFLGTFSVLTEPHAVISVGSIRIGEADAQGRGGPFETRTGDHLIRASFAASGFERVEPLRVAHGTAPELDLRGRRAGIKIVAAPWAAIAVNGRPHGKTPLPEIGVLEGTHLVVLENPELGVRVERVVRVDAGRTVDVKVDLRRSIPR